MRNAGKGDPQQKVSFFLFLLEVLKPRNDTQEEEVSAMMNAIHNSIKSFQNFKI